MDIEGTVAALFEAHKRYEMLILDEPYEGRLAPPAPPEALEAFESKLGFKLPADYRAFLTLHNGWSDFDGEGKLLAIEDHSSDWTQEIITNWSEIWDSEDPNPFTEGAIPIMLGEDIENFLVMSPTKRNISDDPMFFLYNNMEIEESFDSFGEYLALELETLKEMISEETEGDLEE